MQATERDSPACFAPLWPEELELPALPPAQTELICPACPQPPLHPHPQPPLHPHPAK